MKEERGKKNLEERLTSLEKTVKIQAASLAMIWCIVLFYLLVKFILWMGSG